MASPRLVRLARPEDWAAVVRLHLERNAEDGTDYALPDFFARDENGVLTDAFLLPVVFALVTENGLGEVTSSCYFELCGEMCFAGGKASDTAELRQNIQAAGYILAERYKVQSLFCRVPQTLLPSGRREGPIARALAWAGFKRVDQLAHFFLDLRRK